MQKSTKLMLIFGAVVGILWSAAWSYQDGALNLWPFTIMVIPIVVIVVMSALKGKSKW